MAMGLGSGCAQSFRYDRSLDPATLRAEPTRLPGASWIDLPLTLHYATRDGLTSMTPERAQASIDQANLALAPYGIRLFASEHKILPQGYARVDDNDDRFALAEVAHRNGTIHVFLVEGVALAHPRREKTRVSGMHWRYRGFAQPLRRREYLVVAQDAPATTLAHEIGHALGLTHSIERDNMMCSCKRAPLPTFTDTQGRRMRTGARMLLMRANP